MTSTASYTVARILIGTLLLAPVASAADQLVRCESKDYKRQFCSVETHGYVQLQRQLSKHECRQGHNWDWDRRGIWVDDGCAGEFRVETRHHTDGHEQHKGDKAIAAGAALALIAAAAVAAEHHRDDHHRDDHYRDENYGHGGHSSYVPEWLIGDFTGYNIKYGTEVKMRIDRDGRSLTWLDGQELRGYVNDGRLYVGDYQFRLDRAGEGFTTTQLGDTSNKVHYARR